MTRNDISREWLIEHYSDKKQSFRECANIIGCSQSTIEYNLRKYDIKIRTKSEGQECRKTNTSNKYLSRTCQTCGKEITGRWYCLDCYKKETGNSESKRRNNRETARKNSKL